jgi:hypothetical protein
MRIASTLAITHEGKGVTIADLTVPLETQKQDLKKLIPLRTHPVYAMVVYQETHSTEPARVLRFAFEPAVAPAETKKKSK